MVEFGFIVDYLIFAGIMFIVIFIMTPIVYTFWFQNLINFVPNTAYAKTFLIAANLYFQMYKILGIMIPAIIIGYGFSVAARKGTQPEIDSYYEE